MKIKANKKAFIKQNDIHGGWDNSLEEGYEERTKWYEEISPDPKNIQSITDQMLIELKDEAKKCLDSETATYNIKNSKTNPDFRWMKTIMAKGTVSDKLASYTIMIQDHPVYNLDTIRNLISMVKVGKKKECIAVMETLSELFISDLLRPDIKLKPFYQRPLASLKELSSGNTTTRRKYLCYWYFEDQLKECYTIFVQALNKAAQDTVESNKEKAIAAMSNLLAGNPEQEKHLLSNIINKLGDPSQKVASKTMYCLTRLLEKHSNMQGVVLKEIEKLLFRPNVGHKAQYYSLCFLTQFYLNHDAHDVARKLIEVYFSFFKKCIKEGEVDTRLMSALLTGVNRAYPYAKMELDKISEHIDTIYRVVHIASFTVSLHALTLLYQVSEYSDNINDRFYSALYKKLMDVKVNTTSHQALLLNLVYKSLTRDKESSRIAAFIKRLLQLCLHVQPSFACGILFLISQIITKKENTGLYTLQQSTTINDDDDDEEEKYMDIKDKNDTNENIVDDNDEDNKNEEDNEKIDLKEDADVKPGIELLNPKVSSWYHCATSKNTRICNQYNPTARNPLYAGAEYSAYLELTQLKYHFHPSVSLFAEKVLKKEKISYSGDPLKDFTLIRFLDRFVFKNPKKQEEIQSKKSTFGKRKNYLPKGLRSLPLTSSNYLNESKKKIPVEEMFMFTYLKEKYKDREIKDEEYDSDLESVASEEFEEMLDKMSGFKNTVDDDIDYMNEIGNLQERKKLNKNNTDNDENASEAESENEDDDDDEINDLSDDDNEIDHLSDDDNESADDMDEDFNSNDEMNDDDKELLQDGDDDESDIVFDSDEEDTNTKNKIKKKLKKFSKDSIFASAEEFASILEDEGASGNASGTSHQFSNTDKADVKQLDWEEKRNRWLNGYETVIGKGRKNFKRKPNFNKKRSSTNKFSNKNKKIKRE